jgi:Immunity protein 52
MSILLAEKWADQAGRQLAARGGRDLEWYFAEEEAAAEAELIVATDLAFGRKMKVIPWLASLITVPAAPVIVEHLPNGGLLMSATRETFDVENPAHMAAARQIGAAIASLNDLPWAERARA